MNDSRFLYHEPCPECGSRDNLGVWDDGHKYCFGCHWKENGTLTIKDLNQRILNHRPNIISSDPFIDPANFTTVIRRDALLWLRKYGITDTEIKLFKLMWEPSTESLVFPVMINNSIKVVNKRCFGYNSPNKYISLGRKSIYHNELCTNIKPIPQVVVVVEDFVSAIKVGRCLPCIPLLGSSMPQKLPQLLCKRYEAIRVWLDFDKAFQSVLEASRAAQYFQSARSIISDADPKDYSDAQILQYLKNSGIMFPSGN